ncbi:alpha/beta fold hydrolase [Microbulbifer variabilis]|uniref:alpha/beta fold hydrolase n=1 Tax=Microbulbifer variabilis TaxID=266805 RepID=UPI00037192D5|nr:alpha/beta hydrolase [Microbulbifer variabilis]
MIFWLVLILLLILIWLVWIAFFSPSLSRNELSEYSFNQLSLENGFSVNYREIGPEGHPVLLCFHGGGDSLSAWNDWVKILSEDYHLILVDLPGHGLTDPLPGGTYTPKHFADFIAKFIEAMKLEKFVMIGHSFGGNSVLRYLVEHPDTVEAAILVSPGGYRCDKGLEMPTGMARFVISHWGRHLVSHLGSRGLIRRILHSKMFYDPHALSETLVERIYLLSRYEKNRGTALNLVANASVNFQPLNDLENIKTPTLFIWGADDQIIPLEVGRYFSDKIPGSQLITYENIGHMAHVENAKISADDAIKFIKGLQ